jgi:tubulin-specific chaperone A
MVLDLNLGDISGFDLLEQLHEKTEALQLPIIIYTGQDLSKEEEACLHKYAESIVIKGAKAQERLLDEVTLFLHRVESDLPEEQRRKLQILHEKEMVLDGKTILLVDDDMRNIFALSSVLEEKGLTVLVAEHGKEALELLSRHADIALVLMDIMMPEMDGYTAMQKIRNSESDIRNVPIIALTAKAMKGDRKRCIEAGANDYLAKPVDPDRLLSLLRVWLY